MKVIWYGLLWLPPYIAGSLSQAYTEVDWRYWAILFPLCGVFGVMVQVIRQHAIKESRQ